MFYIKKGCVLFEDDDVTTTEYGIIIPNIVLLPTRDNNTY